VATSDAGSSVIWSLPVQLAHKVLFEFCSIGVDWSNDELVEP
jgi:hypothetical protein